MKKTLLLLTGALGASALFGQPEPAAARRPGEYAKTADSLPQPGVPKGRLEGPFEWRSTVLRGTVRRYWIWIPAQYTGEKPAGLLVFQDGQRATHPGGDLDVPQVLENLVHQGAIPVTIGLFVTPGNLSDRYPDNLALTNPNNRAQEYDALSDLYVRMLVEELIPEVKKRYAITDDPEGRVIGGTSSGAICAWTAAWERPDQFRKVISLIGSYVSIGYRPARGNQPMVPGGDLYPTLIRKNPPKPIRIFLQDGSADLDNAHGNWFLANQQMLAALQFANAQADRQKLDGPRYDIRHEWGDGAHSDKHGGVLLPEILRWMFRDWKGP
ncbi:MAG TPA: alpha/beta hydrolase-fold protein [Opitutaceae bacterium]|nr:alpha/beta hydrolase-fold protein [Opitutaceae bacterium]